MKKWFETIILCQNWLTFLIRNKNVIKTNGYSIISQRILDKKILIFCSKNSNFVIQNLNLVEISGLSSTVFKHLQKTISFLKLKPNSCMYPFSEKLVIIFFTRLHRARNVRKSMTTIVELLLLKSF